MTDLRALWATPSFRASVRFLVGSLIVGFLFIHFSEVILTWVNGG